MEYDNDLAIVIAWPEIPTRGDERWIRLFKRLGIVKNLHFKVGHAAIVLVRRHGGELAYYDFGRYITPIGLGRARAAQSDPRLALRTKAILDPQGGIANLRTILDEMQLKEEATHGAGIMFFSIATGISFTRASAFADRIVEGGPIKYGPVAGDCNSCSRYVAQILLAGFPAKHPRRNPLRFPESFKPSPMSNVVNATAEQQVYQFDGNDLSVSRMSRLQSFRYQARLIGESLSKSTAGSFPSDHVVGHTRQPERPALLDKRAHWLGGIGEGAWYVIEPQAGHNGMYCQVSRYTPDGALQYVARYLPDKKWDPDQPYQLTYDTEYRFVTLEQGGTAIRLTLVEDEETVPANHSFAI